MCARIYEVRKGWSGLGWGREGEGERGKINRGRIKHPHRRYETMYEANVNWHTINVLNARGSNYYKHSRVKESHSYSSFISTTVSAASVPLVMVHFVI